MIRIKEKWFFLFPFLFLFSGCYNKFNPFHREKPFVSDALVLEVEEIKRTLTANQADLRLVEEKVEKENRSDVPLRKEELHRIEKRLLLLEKEIERVNNYLKSFISYTQETSNSFAQYKEWMAQVDGKLYELSSLKNKHEKERSLQSYSVKAGDSLEKIARKFNISVEKIKQLNNLDTDKILVGQELQIAESLR